MRKIIIVDEEKDFYNTFAFRNKFSIDFYEKAEPSLSALKKHPYALMICESHFKDMDCLQLIEKTLSLCPHLPIIFLTARSMTEDKITGLSIGGDDYIPKPFSMEELLLKIKVFLKRSNNHPGKNSDAAETKKIGRFIFLPGEHTLSIGSHTRKLTLKEVELIQLFAENTNKVLSRNEILEKIWGSNDYFLGRSLDVFISRLRKYFKADPNIKIINLHGIGFRFSAKK